MRTIALLIFALACLGAVPSSAAPINAGLTVFGDELSSSVVDVAYRCGRYHHWVRGHHLRDGRWIRGHCAENHWRH